MASTTKHILKNLSALTFANLITGFLGFVFILYITRVLSPAEIGKYYFLFSVFSIALLFGDFGINNYYFKKWSQKKDHIHADFNLGLSAKILFSCFLFFLSVLFGIFTNGLFYEVLLLGIALVFDILTVYFIFYYSSQNKHEIRAFIETCEKILFVCCAAGLLYFSPTLLSVIIGFLISKIYGFVHVFCLYRGGKLKISLNLAPIIQLFKKAWIYFFIAIFISLYFKIDSVMLKYLQSYEDVSWYNIAYSINNVIAILPEIIIFSIFPSLSYICSKNRKESHILLHKSFYYILLLAIPITIGGIITADSIIITLFTDTYTPSILAFQLLLIANFFVFLNYLLANYLICCDKQTTFLKITGSLVLLNIGLNFILIPYYSFIGAAIATIITEIANYGLLRHYIQLRLLRVILLKIIIVGGLMGLFSYLLNPFLSLWVIILCSAIIYAILLYLFRLHSFKHSFIKT